MQLRARLLSVLQILKFTDEFRVRNQLALQDTRTGNEGQLHPYRSFGKKVNDADTDRHAAVPCCRRPRGASPVALTSSNLPKRNSAMAAPLRSGKFFELPFSKLLPTVAGFFGLSFACSMATRTIWSDRPATFEAEFLQEAQTIGNVQVCAQHLRSLSLCCALPGLVWLMFLCPLLRFSCGQLSCCCLYVDAVSVIMLAAAHNGAFAESMPRLAATDCRTSRVPEPHQERPPWLHPRTR